MINLDGIFANPMNSPIETVKVQSNESLDSIQNSSIDEQSTEEIHGAEYAEEDLRLQKIYEEQTNVLNRDDFSFESSFVQSVEAEEDEEMNSMDEGFDDFDSMDDSMDSGSGDDMGGDGGFEESGSDDMTGGGNGSAGGVDDLDLNKGSSLNAFTQVNQKLYHIQELNKLLKSIRNTISRYNDIYVDWSELNQLKSLAAIVDEERSSFVMQENPENLIKLRLYQEQYALIVKKISSMINEKAKKQKA